jgi:hypothetical protein
MTTNVLGRMRFACCVTKATDTHSEYLTLIALPVQQWLREVPSMSPLYVNCLYFILMFNQGGIPQIEKLLSKGTLFRQKKCSFGYTNNIST